MVNKYYTFGAITAVDCLYTGMGAFAAPLVATQFSRSRHWSFFYLISLGIAITNVATLTAVFQFKSQDGTM